MAIEMVVSASPVVAASQHRGKPRNLFRGVPRTLIRKSLAKLNALLNADWREMQRAGTVGYNPALITGAADSHLEQCFTRVMNRLKECMLLKEGDE